jgi:hypothetical protein
MIEMQQFHDFLLLELIHEVPFICVSSWPDVE